MAMKQNGRGYKMVKRSNISLPAGGGRREGRYPAPTSWLAVKMGSGGTTGKGQLGESQLGGNLFWADGRR